MFLISELVSIETELQENIFDFDDKNNNETMIIYSIITFIKMKTNLCTQIDLRSAEKSFFTKLVTPLNLVSFFTKLQ